MASETASVTASNAFDAVLAKVERGLADRAGTLFGHGIRGEDFPLELTVPDQMIVLPDRRIDANAFLRVVEHTDNELVIQLLMEWKSIYGQHRSCSAYKVTRDGDNLTIDGDWRQAEPIPSLANLEIHTGGVWVGDYHQRVLDEIRNRRASPISKMLFDGNIVRSIPSEEFPPLAAVIVRLTPEL